MIMKRMYKIVTFSFILLFLSCGEDSKQIDTENSEIIEVTTASVTANENIGFLSVSGKIQSAKSANLSTRMMGFVDKVFVNVGDKVKKGAPLIAINNESLMAKKAQVNASIVEAQVAFNNAEKDYKRFKNLYANKSATQKEMDDMTSQYEMAKARLEAASQMKIEINSEFAYSNLVAPFNGVITSKNINVGDMANPGAVLLSIENPENFEVIAMVPETEISDIQNGVKVEVVIKSINKTLEGVVSEVSTSAKNSGGQYLVKIALDSTKANVLSGMFATVQFPVERNVKSRTILIPKKALVTNGQLSGIYTVSQSETALLRWLRLGRHYGDQVEVLSGINADEVYIVSSEGKLFNGAKIIVQ